uniref:RNA-dependent RNA polymerase n=1 Tax=Verticillium dahliae RNA virus TaxID=1945524 RepID=A0A2K8FNU8_9VIRU|nr:RNA-dependent RNA polymerase [Verticillium dahliae RNA virus]
MVPDHHRRKMRTAWTSGLEGTWVPGVHAACCCNERAALLHRALGPVPWPDDRAVGQQFASCFKSLRLLAARYCGYKWTHLQTAESYTGHLRRRYLEAERSLRLDGPLSRRDYRLTAFLKAEKVTTTKFHEPRLIFPRSPRYNLVLASWLKPFEHWLWGRLTLKWFFKGREPVWLERHLAGYGSSRVVAKGLSPRQRANLIARKFGSFESCVVFEADGKGFEAHVSSVQLREEHSVYAAAYGGDRSLSRVLSRQLVLAGSTPGGWVFSRPGGRASGDFNTGMGNSLIMLASVAAGIPKDVPYDLLVDGDNALVFLAGADAARVLPYFHDRVLNECGQELTLESPVSVLEKVRFGQSAPVNLGGGLGWTMVREWTKVLSGFASSHRWLNEPKFARRWLHDVCRCELSLARGVPVLQEVFLRMLRHIGRDGKRVSEAALVDYFVIGAWLAGEEDVVPVSLEARLSFERAFGLSVSDQRLMEIGTRPGFGLAESVVDYPAHTSALEAEPGLVESSWYVRY